MAHRLHTGATTQAEHRRTGGSQGFDACAPPPRRAGAGQATWHISRSGGSGPGHCRLWLTWVPSQRAVRYGASSGPGHGQVESHGRRFRTTASAGARLGRRPRGAGGRRAPPSLLMEQGEATQTGPQRTRLRGGRRRRRVLPKGKKRNVSCEAPRPLASTPATASVAQGVTVCLEPPPTRLDRTNLAAFPRTSPLNRPRSTAPAAGDSLGIPTEACRLAANHASCADEATSKLPRSLRAKRGLRTPYLGSG